MVAQAPDPALLIGQRLSAINVELAAAFQRGLFDWAADGLVEFPDGSVHAYHLARLAVVASPSNPGGVALAIVLRLDVFRSILNTDEVRTLDIECRADLVFTAEPHESGPFVSLLDRYWVGIDTSSLAIARIVVDSEDSNPVPDEALAPLVGIVGKPALESVREKLNAFVPRSVPASILGLLEPIVLPALPELHLVLLEPEASDPLLALVGLRAGGTLSDLLRGALQGLLYETQPAEPGLDPPPCGTVVRIHRDLVNAIAFYGFLEPLKAVYNKIGGEFLMARSWRSHEVDSGVRYAATPAGVPSYPYQFKYLDSEASSRDYLGCMAVVQDLLRVSGPEVDLLADLVSDGNFAEPDIAAPMGEYGSDPGFQLLTNYLAQRRLDLFNENRKAYLAAYSQAHMDFFDVPPESLPTRMPFGEAPTIPYGFDHDVVGRVHDVAAALKQMFAPYVEGADSAVVEYEPVEFGEAHLGSAVAAAPSINLSADVAVDVLIWTIHARLAARLVLAMSRQTAYEPFKSRPANQLLLKLDFSTYLSPYAEALLRFAGAIAGLLLAMFLGPALLIAAPASAILLPTLVAGFSLIGGKVFSLADQALEKEVDDEAADALKELGIEDAAVGVAVPAVLDLGGAFLALTDVRRVGDALAFVGETTGRIDAEPKTKPWEPVALAAVSRITAESPPQTVRYEPVSSLSVLEIAWFIEHHLTSVMVPPETYDSSWWDEFKPFKTELEVVRHSVVDVRLDFFVAGFPSGSDVRLHAYVDGGEVSALDRPLAPGGVSTAGGWTVRSERLLHRPAVSDKWGDNPFASVPAWALDAGLVWRVRAEGPSGWWAGAAEASLDAWAVSSFPVIALGPLGITADCIRWNAVTKDVRDYDSALLLSVALSGSDEEVEERLARIEAKLAETAEHSSWEYGPGPLGVAKKLADLDKGRLGGKYGPVPLPPIDGTVLGGHDGFVGLAGIDQGDMPGRP
ncbi:MAG: hypothetical protein FJ087_03740 [Deltaproteobacteria bacterium]|nr:hypothetical protein [Deltaproteobacteria bacterium]